MKNNWLATAFIAVFLGGSPVAAQPQLKYVVIVSRHGVRSPTWEAARLNEYSARPWPNWGVPTGNLTPHGRMLIKLMGAYYHNWLSAEHLFNTEGCRQAEQVYIWADTEQRTIETGRAFGESLLPNCRIATHSQPEPDNDPVFSGVGDFDPELALEALRARLGSDPQKLLTDHRDALAALESLLSGGQTVAKKTVESDEKIDVAIKGKSVVLNGPFDASSTLSEDLLLEYVNGMRRTDLGWGRLNKQNLFQILELQTVFTDLMRRTPYLARARGSNLLAHVLRSMNQAASGDAIPGSIGRQGDVVLILSGHDTNQSNLSGMLGLTWKLPGYQPEETPPGGALIFSLWRDSSTGALFVKTQYVAQSADQMRDAVPLTASTPPEKVDVSVPACKSATQDGGCPWQVFKHVVEAAIDPKFTQ